MGIVATILALSVIAPSICDERERLQAVVVEAFQESHDGYSSDEVILNDELNAQFIAACKKQLTGIEPARFNWTLINLRKAGKLSLVKTTRRGRSTNEDVVPVAEIVSRSLMDRTGNSIDRILTDPQQRSEFDQAVRNFDDRLDLYLVRKAAFQLRKTRQLKPELITRIADWDREICKSSVAEFLAEPAIVPTQPGVYIFHDETGYLYIGQSDNLQKRLTAHLEESSNLALSKYLTKGDLMDVHIEIHAFPVDSRMNEVRIRRAYESELIRSRKPRFNILP